MPARLLLTGAAFSPVMPFLPLYVESLGVTGHGALNMWSGLVFSITFLFSYRFTFLGRPCRSQRQENHAPALSAGDGCRDAANGAGAKYLAVLILRALLGLLGGFIPNANALIATRAAQ